MTGSAAEQVFGDGPSSESEEAGALGQPPASQDAEESQRSREDAGTTGDSEAESRADSSEQTQGGESAPDKDASANEDWKAKAEKAAADARKAEDAFREQQARADRLEAQERERNRRAQEAQNRQISDAIARLETHRQRRHEHQDYMAELMSDPAAWDQYERDRDLVSDARAEARLQYERTAAEGDKIRAEWEPEIKSLADWATVDDDGPKMSDSAYKDFLKQHAGAFSSDRYPSAKAATDAAKLMLRGMYIDVYAARVRESSDRDANNKAKATLGAKIPGVTSSKVIDANAKNKTPAASILGTLENSPASRVTREMFGG